ncbi:MAG: tryptophan synthase subunit alpha [Deltaproteobacteria bacterium]|nr:tryptophan synthase subunit alpha [Deltaproteobacteria bacterium]
MLESYIRKQRRHKDILLMTHIVLGYPSFEDCFRIIKGMVRAGVDLMELQVPFSEPVADGPVILHANHQALKNGATVQRCLDFAREVTQSFKIPFLNMTYYNILFKYGVGAFVSRMVENGLQGSIVADLPPEEGETYLAAMQQANLSPIFIFSPTTSHDRMVHIASHARGFIYCVARKGVTGADTAFSGEVPAYLSRCREATSLPTAVGFGVREKADVSFLRGKADIAVIGSRSIEIVETSGVDAVEGFIRSLR